MTRARWLPAATGACMLLAACARPGTDASRVADALPGQPVPVASDSIDTPWPRGSVRADSFASPILGTTKHYLVYLPPSYGRDGRRRYPVAYYLHGLWGDETNWVRLGRLDRAMDSLVAGGAPEMIVVMPDGDDSWYTSWESPRGWAECAAGELREPAGRYCVRSHRYDAYLADDLVAHVDSTLLTQRDRRRRAIAGLSMGGYGAVHLAALHPDIYSAAASHSGVLSPLFVGPRPFADSLRRASDMEALESAWGSPIYRTMVPAFGGELDGWARRDPARVLRDLKTRGGPVPDLYVDTGFEDRLVVDGNRAFRWELDRMGVPVEYHEYAGAHSWTYWRANVGRSLTWLAGRLTRR
jgi:S-formylglutathione hydrolase FrmB